MGGKDGQDIEITCYGTNEFFNLRGCKRRCSIFEGYVINKSGLRYDSNNVEDYDTFADFNTDAGDSVFVTQVMIMKVILMTILL